MITEILIIVDTHDDSTTITSSVKTDDVSLFHWEKTIPEADTEQIVEHIEKAIPPILASI